METTKKKSMGFGLRGWILIVVLFVGFMTFQVFTNYPLNILSDFYGGSQAVAMLMTIGTFIGVILQVVISAFVGKIKSIKLIAAIVGAVAIICCIGVAAIPFTMIGLWKVAYLVCNITVTMYALFFLSIIAGQWFPRRKGTVMGISTIAYPVANGVIGFFATTALGSLETTGSPSILKAFIPFLIIAVVGFVLFLVFISDYPEQVGAYRDNDKNMTPEIANKMMMEEIENKRTTVWTTGHIFANRDFWLASVTCGLVLMGAVGCMTQSNAIISAFPELNYTIIMMVIAVCGAIGSWLLGVLDTKFGTKKAMVIATILMILSGIFGIIACVSGIGVFTVISLVLVAIFMGASSNFTVSVAAQYWRREDFSGVFACLNPIANIFNALAAIVVATLISTNLGVMAVFIFLGVLGIIGTILMLLFSGKHVQKIDNKYREKAGKAIDDELSNRK